MNVFKIRFNNLISESPGFTNRGLASYLGVHENTISNYKNGNNIPNVEELIKIAEYFDVDIRYLIYEKFENKTNATEIIREEIGLTDNSIKTLKMLKKPSKINDKTFKNYMFEDSYNMLIKSNFFSTSTIFTSMIVDLNKLDRMVDNIEYNVLEKKNIDKNGVVSVISKKESKKEINSLKKIYKENIIKEIDSIIEELKKFTFKYSFKLLQNNKTNEINNYYEKINLWKIVDKEKDIKADFSYYLDSIGLENYLESQKENIEDVLHSNEIKRFLHSTIAKSIMVIKSELKDRYSYYLRTI